MKKDETRWTPPRPRLVVLLASLLVILHAFDAAATLTAVAQGATELNPVMHWALARGPLAFIAIKMAMVGVFASMLAATALWKARPPRERKFAWRALMSLTAVYAVVFVWHMLVITSLIPTIPVYDA